MKIEHVCSRYYREQQVVISGDRRRGKIRDQGVRRIYKLLRFKTSSDVLYNMGNIGNI